MVITSGGSRPLVKGRGREGGGTVSKNFVRPFGPQLGLKIKVGQTPPLDPPLITYDPCMQSHVGYVHTVTDN